MDLGGSQHPSKTLVVATAVALVIGFAMPAMAWHSDLPVVAEIEGTGEDAWGVDITLHEEGDYAIELEGYTDPDASQIAIGAMGFDSSGDPSGSSTLMALTSQERVIASQQDVSEAFGQDGLKVTGESFGETMFLGVAATQEDVDPGTDSYGFYLAGFENATLTVRADVDVTVETSQGAIHAMSETDFDDGALNLQAQAPHLEAETVSTTGPGAKVIQDSTQLIDVEHQLMGDFLALPPGDCQVIQGSTCVPLDALLDQGLTIAEDTCETRTGIDCGQPREDVRGEDSTSISWDGPDGAGEEGYEWYLYRGESPGTYAFNVDESTDAYGWGYDSETGTFFGYEEHHIILVAVDLAPP